MSHKELFDLLYSMLKDEYTRFFDVSRQNVALLFLVLGWLLTSAEARAFLARYAWIRWSSMALATAWFILNAIKEIHRVGSSSRFYAALLDVDWNIATRYCRRFLVDYGAVLPVLLLELALIVLILVLVWCCASRPVAPTAVKE